MEVKWEQEQEIEKSKEVTKVTIEKVEKVLKKLEKKRISM